MKDHIWAHANYPKHTAVVLVSTIEFMFFGLRFSVCMGNETIFSLSVMHVCAPHLYICVCVFAQQKLSTCTVSNLHICTFSFVFLSRSGLGSLGYWVNNHKHTHTHTVRSLFEPTQKKIRQGTQSTEDV